MNVEHLAQVAQLAQNGLGSAALLLAGWWFLYTTQFKPRLQFDIDLKYWALADDIMLGQISLIFENKGFVEHKFYTVTLSVHGHELNHKEKDGRPAFRRRIMPKIEIKPTGIFFVRPGVTQVINRMFTFKKEERVIRITGGFVYRKGDKTPPHTYRRFFNVASGEAGALVVGEAENS